MKLKEINSMRMKQLVLTNGLVLTSMVTLLVIANIFTIKSSFVFFFLGSTLVLQSLYQLVKRDSPKSIIPIFEKVAIYEKQKMGKEWWRQRRSSSIWNLILAGMMFWQFSLYRGSEDEWFLVDFKFMFILIMVIMIILNISMVIHFKKVDHAASSLELKGYAWKSNLTAILLGIAFAFVLIFLTLFYILV